MTNLEEKIKTSQDYEEKSQQNLFIFIIKY